MNGWLLFGCFMVVLGGWVFTHGLEKIHPSLPYLWVGLVSIILGVGLIATQ